MIFIKNKKWIITTLCLTGLVFQTGCSSLGKSVGFGSAVGAGAGAALGGIIDPGKDGKYRTRNVIVGAGVGAIAGGLVGSSLHTNKERDKELAFLKGK